MESPLKTWGLPVQRQFRDHDALRVELRRRFRAYQDALLACYQEQDRTARPASDAVRAPMRRTLLDLCIWEAICDAV